MVKVSERHKEMSGYLCIDIVHCIAFSVHLGKVLSVIWPSCPLCDAKVCPTYSRSFPSVLNANTST